MNSMKTYSLIKLEKILRWLDAEEEFDAQHRNRHLIMQTNS